MSELRCFESCVWESIAWRDICGTGGDSVGVECDAGEVVTAGADGGGAVGNIGVGVPTVGEERSQRRISRLEPP